MDSFNAFGRVFYPDPDKDVILGANLYSNDGGIFIEFDHPRFQIPNKPSIILGEFTGYGPITCFENEIYAFESGQGGNRCRYKVSYLFTGMLFSLEENIRFNIAIFHVDTMIEWFNIKTIKTEFLSTKIEFGPDQTIELDINGFEKAYFKFTYSYNSKRFSVSANEQVTLTLTTLLDKNLDHFNNTVIKLKKLFSFLSNVNFQIDDISLYSKPFNVSPELPPDTLLKVKLFDQRKTISPCPTSEFLRIKYIDIKENFPTLVSKWLSVSEDNIVIDLLMEKAYNHELSAKTYFLNVCFALEVYHNNYISNQRLSKEEFKRIKEYLNQTLKDPEVIKWVDNKIKLGNQPSFRDRLSHFKIELSEIYDSDSEILLKKIIYTRNSLVHPSIKSKYIVKDDFDLHLISITLETVIKGAILKDLGIEPENILKIFVEAKNHIDVLRRRNNSEWLF